MAENNNLIPVYNRKLLLLIIIATVARILVASDLELNSAEVYYWVYSLRLQWNYFDHPPIVAWLIRLTTFNLAVHNELFVRFGAIISSALCTWLIYLVGRNIGTAVTGWYAALLYTSSIYGSLVAGTFILPDSPQMVFWFASILILIKLINIDTGGRHIQLWCVFGLAAGCCIMCKVHGAFIWFGVFVFAITTNRHWLKNPGIYLAGIITLMVASPIIIWNFQNDFLSYKFHSNRVSLAGAGIHWSLFTAESLGVIFFILNPFNFFLLFRTLQQGLKAKHFYNKKHIQLILSCSLPLVLCVIFISFFRETKVHWPGPALSSLLLIPALKLSLQTDKKPVDFPNVIKLALLYLVIICVSEVLIIKYYPGTVSEQKEGIKMGEGDLTLDMFGWKDAAEKYSSLYQKDLAGHIMPAQAPIIVTNWFPAAHIDYYLSDRTKQQTIGIGDISNLHQYYLMNKDKSPLRRGDAAYYIVPSNLFDYKSFDKVVRSFDHYEMASVFSQMRSGIVCKEMYVFRLTGYKGIDGRLRDKRK